MAIVRVISDANICLVYTKILPGGKTNFLGGQKNNVYSNQFFFLIIPEFIQQTICILLVWIG